MVPFPFWFSEADDARNVDRSDVWSFVDVNRWPNSISAMWKTVRKTWIWFQYGSRHKYICHQLQQQGLCTDLVQVIMRYDDSQDKEEEENDDNFKPSQRKQRQRLRKERRKRLALLP